MKVRRIGFIASDELAVDDKGAWYGGERRGDTVITVSEISAIAREESYITTALVDLDAEAVELDLMNPSTPDGRRSTGEAIGRNEIRGTLKLL
jgi:hypothetical protein